MRTRSLMYLGLVVAVGACASSGEADDPNAPQACVVIDNSGGGTAGRVMLQSEGGERMRVGEVPMGRSLSHCFRRSSFGGLWWVTIEDVAADRLDPADQVRGNRVQGVQQNSPTFYISPGDEVTWEVHLDRISVGRIGSGGQAL